MIFLCQQWYSKLTGILRIDENEKAEHRKSCARLHLSKSGLVPGPSMSRVSNPVFGHNGAAAPFGDSNHVRNSQRHVRVLVATKSFQWASPLPLRAIHKQAICPGWHCCGKTDCWIGGNLRSDLIRLFEGQSGPRVRITKRIRAIIVRMLSIPKNGVVTAPCSSVLFRVAPSAEVWIETQSMILCVLSLWSRRQADHRSIRHFPSCLS